MSRLALTSVLEGGGDCAMGVEETAGKRMVFVSHWEEERTEQRVGRDVTRRARHGHNGQVNGIAGCGIASIC